MKQIKTLFRSLPPALLILLFVYAAVSKLAAFSQFKGEMHNQNMPAEAAALLVYLVPAAELAAAFMLLTTKAQRTGLLLSIVLMALFTGYIALVLAGFWDRVPCSCGGVLKGMSWGTHLVFNLFFLLIAIAGLISHDPDQKLQST